MVTESSDTILVMSEDVFESYRKKYDVARSKSRRELINEAIATITTAYAEQTSETFQRFVQDRKIDITALEAKYGEKIDAILATFNMQAISSAERENVLISAEFFYQFGESVARVYSDFASALAEILELNNIKDDTTILFSGRDSLPLFIAAQNNERLKSRPIKWLKLGRRQIYFMLLPQWWTKESNVLVDALGDKLDGASSTVVVDFGFRSTVDRTVLSYLAFLNKKGLLNYPKPNLDLSCLFHLGNYQRKLDFEDVKRYLSDDTPEDVLEIMEEEDAANRTKTWGYLNNLFEVMVDKNSGIELPFLEISDQSMSFKEKFFTFLEALQEIGASVTESTRDSFYTLKQGREEKALPAKPLQISMGRLAFLQAMKNSASSTKSIFSPENISGLADAYQQIIEYPGAFISLFDSKRNESDELYRDPTIPTQIRNLQDLLTFTGREKASQ